VPRNCASGDTADCILTPAGYDDHSRPPSYDYPSPASYPDYSYRTQTWMEASGLLLRVILVAALVSSSFLVQLVAIWIAYWAFKQRRPCGCCYENAGVPNCPSAPPASFALPSPSPRDCEGTRSTIRVAGSEVLLPRGGRRPSRGLRWSLHRGPLFRLVLYTVRAATLRPGVLAHVPSRSTAGSVGTPSPVFYRARMRSRSRRCRCAHRPPHASPSRWP
jgi:hypothetical protein